MRNVGWEALNLIDQGFKSTPISQILSGFLRSQPPKSTVLIGAIGSFSSLKWQFFLQSMRCFLWMSFEKPSMAKISGRATVTPGKKRRLRRSFPSPCGKRFCVTENISRNGKHSLLSPEHTMFRDSKTGRISRPVPRLFAGQSEEANSPFPKSISGTKQHRNGMNKSWTQSIMK